MGTIIALLVNYFGNKIEEKYFKNKKDNSNTIEKTEDAEEKDEELV